ncbi:TMV resistance protein N-like [Eucalyptus grandis]|uniref:TMV resistance protein N-like n=1 Tax=Eucalyptus grandis TaxID=71139 RepID=UPI00192EC2A2|nr:TMV resistance protein N-like [Eucalyptus grandis]
MKRKWDSPGPSTTSASVNDGDSSSGAEFEVFLNFRGPDTRLNFTDSLYHTLVKAGIRVFRDNEKIRQGEKIRDELLHAIKSSKIYVPIFSRNYASSAWCLRELAHMVECWGKAKDKMILPIFYDVDPDDVKLRTRLYLDSLEKHEGKFGCDVLQWKEALTEVAKIRGLDLKNRGHGEIINAIMDKVVTKLMKRRRNLPNHLVGIHDQVEAIVDLLNKGSCDFRYLVIHGMGGIGKTTLASAVFNRISNQFEGYSFLLDVRESAQHGRIIDLQKQLLVEILQVRSLEIHNSVDVGINTIRERFCHKKVLIVIDDVDKWDQLSKLAGKSDRFGPGSKIIITTRDINFLPIKEEEEEEEEGSFQAHAKEFEIYDMKEMDSFDALELFSQHALGMDFPPPHYVDISRKITYKTGGLPLALEVIGSSLFGKNKTIWKDTLKKLHSMPKQEVFVKLKISYDMLDDAQREIFLDIACYFIGKDRLHPFYMWKAFGYFPKTDLLVLTRMSLVKIEEDDTLWMHDQLRDLGREIIRLEDNDPGKRSRLWMPDIALNVVQQKLASNKIVALTLTGDSKGRNFTSEEFSKLPNLRFLELEGGNLVGDFKNLLSKLTWFSWSHFPSKLEVKNLCLEKLVVLELSKGDLGDWAEWEQCMVSNNLKVIHINDGKNLHRTPDFSKCENLKRFICRDCSTIPVVDGSLFKLEHLKHLEIKEDLHISRGTPQLSEFGDGAPNIEWIKGLSKLEYLSFRVKDVTFSLNDLTTLSRLRCLEMTWIDHRSWIALPSGLSVLRLYDLRSPEVKLDDVFGQQLERLHWLHVGGSELLERLSGLSSLKGLEGLTVESCPRLLEIQGVEKLESLKRIHLHSCRSLKRLPGLSELKKLRSLTSVYCPSLNLPDLPSHIDFGWQSFL